VELTSSQRKRLRGLAHALEPVVWIGKGLLSERSLRQVDRELDAHELIKVRFLEGKEEKRELTAELCSRTGAALAGAVGHVAILYRQHSDPKKRRIELDE
jgi:RNA-binding protein